MRNSVHLIVYTARLGGTIRQTGELLRSGFGDAIGGVHLLPYFTPFDGVDAGFDPVDHTAVDPRLGTWEDIRNISRDYQVTTDMIVNHMSSHSAQFRDVLARGQDSPFAPMFLSLSTVFPDGATEDDLARIYRPRPGLPFTAMRVGAEKRLMWTTFTSEQVDIDVESEPGRAYLLQILDALAGAGVSLVRLDAVGYAIKRAGTTCFMIPQTFAFIDRIRAAANERGLEVLVEVHSHYEDQVRIATQVDWVYDFALPPLLLHTLFTGDGTALLHWLRVRPHNAMTVLDTHDGIGVIDVGPGELRADGTRPDGLLTPGQVEALVEEIHRRTRGESRQATGAAASNLDLYQVNSTYYAALGGDDQAYLIARAVQFFVPGVPQVYYVGALAGGNDMDLLAATGVGRDINRHRYTPEEVRCELRRPVVRELMALMRIRSTHPAFDGAFSLLSADATAMSLEWRGGDRGEHLARLDVDWRTREASIRLSAADGPVTAPLSKVSALVARLPHGVRTR
jgi:sucrose phosphorylase